VLIVLVVAGAVEAVVPFCVCAIVPGCAACVPDAPPALGDMDGVAAKAAEEMQSVLAIARIVADFMRCSFLQSDAQVGTPAQARDSPSAMRRMAHELERYAMLRISRTAQRAHDALVFNAAGDQP